MNKNVLRWLLKLEIVVVCLMCRGRLFQKWGAANWKLRWPLCLGGMHYVWVGWVGITLENGLESDDLLVGRTECLYFGYRWLKLFVWWLAPSYTVIAGLGLGELWGDTSLGKFSYIKQQIMLFILFLSCFQHIEIILFNPNIEGFSVLHPMHLHGMQYKILAMDRIENASIENIRELYRQGKYMLIFFLSYFNLWCKRIRKLRNTMS